ncbi:MAG: AIR synthase family protein [Anaerolineae bacterium]
MREPTILPTGKLPMELLESLLHNYRRSDPRLVAGPRVGEDVAVIDMGDRYMVVKTDPITFATDQIGWYAVNINANDIATSGARPLWMLCTLLLPEGRTTPELVETIFAQLHDACMQLDVILVGGHTEVTHGLDRPVAVGVMIGEVARGDLITTAGGQVGDRVVLVKGIPIEGAAIIALEKTAELRAAGYDEAFLRRVQGFLRDPGISVVEPARLAAHHPGVHAMHDPTEGGLVTGLHELAYAARVGLRFDADKVTILPEGRLLCEHLGLDPFGVIASGALIVAVAPEQAESLCAVYTREGIPSACIGELLPPEEGVYEVRGGVRGPLPRYDKDEITRIF